MCDKITLLKNKNYTQFVPPPLTNKHSVMVADTRATGHFCETSAPVINIQHTEDGITVIMPNSATLKSTHTASLGITELSDKANMTHLFQSLASGSLISIGQLCDAGCEAYFNKNTVNITLNGQIIINGHRSNKTKWLRELKMANSKTAKHHINAVCALPTMHERANFYRAAMFSPTISTLCKAIDSGHLDSFPGNITSKQIRKHCGNNEASTKGHLDQQ